MADRSLALGEALARHPSTTCAVTMLRGGAAPHEVRDQLGHSSVQVTEKYSKYVPGGKERAAAAMDRMMSAAYGADGIAL